MLPLKFPDDSFRFEPIFHCFINSCLDFKILQGVVWQLQENQPVIMFFVIPEFDDLTIRLKQYTSFARAGMPAPFILQTCSDKRLWFRHCFLFCSPWHKRLHLPVHQSCLVANLSTSLQSSFLLFGCWGGKKVPSAVSDSVSVLLSRVADRNAVSSITNSAKNQ